MNEDPTRNGTITSLSAKAASSKRKPSPPKAKQFFLVCVCPTNSDYPLRALLFTT
jgi:hypothetical protein